VVGKYIFRAFHTGGGPVLVVAVTSFGDSTSGVREVRERISGPKGREVEGTEPSGPGGEEADISRQCQRRDWKKRRERRNNEITAQQN
jgi:hypothetical protein